MVQVSFLSPKEMTEGFSPENRPKGHTCTLNKSCLINIILLPLLPTAHVNHAINAHINITK